MSFHMRNERRLSDCAKLLRKFYILFIDIGMQKWYLFQNIVHACNKLCEPLLKKYDLPQVSFDILMFLANNPEFSTAQEISEIRNINIHAMRNRRKIFYGKTTKKAAEP